MDYTRRALASRPKTESNQPRAAAFAQLRRAGVERRRGNSTPAAIATLPRRISSHPSNPERTPQIRSRPKSDLNRQIAIQRPISEDTGLAWFNC